jgi:hypothetical protein
MRIHYEPELVEEVVFLELGRREQQADVDLFEQYHGDADAIYDRYSPDERQRKFVELHQTFFRLLGFDGFVDEVLGEFPVFEGQIDSILIGKAFTELEGSAELSRDIRNMGMKIRPRRFLDRPDLLRRIRHEMMHVSDMLDVEFGYTFDRSVQVSTPMEEHIIRDRYGVIWDIYVDGRLTRRGKDTVLGKDDREREFGAFYAKIPYSQRRAIFEDLWSTEKLSHHDVLDMAQDVRKVLERAGNTLGALADERILLPGSPCPLCRFPTYTWMENLREQVDEGVLKLIQEDYPGWEPEEAACERCLEGYSVGAGR